VMYCRRWSTRLIVLNNMQRKFVKNVGKQARFDP
jgi:hypothetical protein